jgi:hypothetical protein
MEDKDSSGGTPDTGAVTDDDTDANTNQDNVQEAAQQPQVETVLEEEELGAQEEAPEGAGAQGSDDVATDSALSGPTLRPNRKRSYGHRFAHQMDFPASTQSYSQPGTGLKLVGTTKPITSRNRIAKANRLGKAQIRKIQVLALKIAREQDDFEAKAIRTITCIICTKLFCQGWHQKT